VASLQQSVLLTRHKSVLLTIVSWDVDNTFQQHVPGSGNLAYPVILATSILSQK